MSVEGAAATHSCSSARRRGKSMLHHAAGAPDLRRIGLLGHNLPHPRLPPAHGFIPKAVAKRAPPSSLRQFWGTYPIRVGGSNYGFTLVRVITIRPPASGLILCAGTENAAASATMCLGGTVSDKVCRSRSSSSCDLDEELRQRGFLLPIHAGDKNDNIIIY